jgi:PEP-CTERM motif
MIRHVAPLAVIIFIVLSGPAVAGPIVDFSSAAGGGTISYAGSGDLVGTDIAIDLVTGISTSQHTGNHTVIQGLLNFTTGDLVGFSNGVYTFGGGGTFTITGGVPDASIANGTTLLTGQLANASVNVGSSSVYLFIGNGVDTLDPALAAYLGMSGGSFTLDQVSIHIDPTEGCHSCGASTSFIGGAYSVHVPDGPVPTATPEPGTLLLLGSGLAGACAFLKRHVRRSGR